MKRVHGLCDFLTLVLKYRWNSHAVHAHMPNGNITTSRVTMYLSSRWLTSCESLYQDQT